MKIFLLTVLLSVLISNSFAHALWIETSATGKKGQKHQIEVFYGEYAANERDSVTKWYSDVKYFTLWLSAPGKEKIRLETKSGFNSVTASFIPESDGLYVLSVSHEAKDLGGTTKYEFLSSATIAVGKAPNYNPASTQELTLTARESKVYKQNAEVKLLAGINGKPLAKKTISVFSPEGWTKEFTTNESGEVVFTPQWSGRYVIEVSNFEKKVGEHNGKDYTAVWQGATSSFLVDK